MIKKVILFFLFSPFLFAQESDSISTVKYLEDQIYIGLSYISLYDTPAEVGQNGFSNSFVLGFIKDMPLNIKGDVAVGLGLGYARNTYYQNIKIYRPTNDVEFELVAGNDFDNNKFTFHMLEMPLEFRWRTSTLEKYKFWRFYAGAKLSDVILSNAKFKAPDTTIKINGIPELNNLQAGLSLAIGYGTWNFNFYYGLTPLFSKAILRPDMLPIDMKDFRIGLIFYIL